MNAVRLFWTALGTRRRASLTLPHFVYDYRKLVRRKLREYPNDRTQALIESIGSPSLTDFAKLGDAQVAALNAYGLRSGMSIYDLGCGCGRTAQALVRYGWKGSYRGVDVVHELVDHVRETCPGFAADVHVGYTIAASDCSLDMVFHWSVFTHLQLEESAVYLEETYRALKPGGRTVFSFLELADQRHHRILKTRIDAIRRNVKLPHLDSFLHRDWVTQLGLSIGFEIVGFTDGNDESRHPQLWQSIAVLQKPAG